LETGGEAYLSRKEKRGSFAPQRGCWPGGEGGWGERGTGGGRLPKRKKGVCEGKKEGEQVEPRRNTFLREKKKKKKKHLLSPKHGKKDVGGGMRKKLV